jgi:hypothetical protein
MEQPGIFYMKIAPQNNFSTNEPISTNKKPIDLYINSLVASLSPYNWL